MYGGCKHSPGYATWRNPLTAKLYVRAAAAATALTAVVAVTGAGHKFW